MIYVILAYISYPVVFLVSRLVRRGSADSFLVFQTAKVGDMICTTPVFREIKRAYPASRLGVVINPVTAPLLKHNPHVDEIIEFGGISQKGLLNKLSFALTLYRKRYSNALILLPNTANILAAYWAMIPRRVSIYPDFAGGTLKRLMGLNTHVERHAPGRMSMETYLISLRHFRIKEFKTDKEVYTTAEAEKKAASYLDGSRPFIGIVPGTANALKDWGKDNFLKLSVKILQASDSSLVIIGTGKDRALGEEFKSRAGFKDRVVNACGDFTLEEAPALIKRLSLVVGVDTGLIYMADALGVPVIDIAGPCSMSDQRPVGEKSFIVQKNDMECVPCSHTFKTPYECSHGHRRCVTGTSPDEVFDLVLKVINGPFLRNRRAPRL